MWAFFKKVLFNTAEVNKNNSIEVNYFIPINFYKIYLENLEDEYKGGFEEFEADYSFEKDTYYTRLPFYSDRPINEIEFEIFATNNGFRNDKYFSNVEVIQRYFYEKYNIKYFFDVRIFNECDTEMYDTYALFNYKTCITQEDFDLVIKPNLTLEILKKVSNDYGAFFFNWDFFLNKSGYNIENSLISYYSTSIPRNFKNVFQDEFTLYFNLFSILFENTHSSPDVQIEGLKFPAYFKFNDVITTYFRITKLNDDQKILFPQNRDFIEFYQNLNINKATFVKHVKDIIENMQDNKSMIKFF